MAFKKDPDMLLVNFWMARADADALIKLANCQGISRSELLRRTARDLIEHDDKENGATA